MYEKPKPEKLSFRQSYRIGFCFVEKLIMCLMLCVILGVLSCDLGQNHNDGNASNLNPKLKSVLYWGFKDPQNYAPNEGPPANSDIQFPVWIKSDKVLVYTGVVENGVSRKGVFEILIDDSTKKFKSYSVYEFSNAILSMGYSLSNNKIFVLYRIGSLSRASSVILGSNQVVIDQDIVGSDWIPWGITTWAGKSGFIFYGQNPVNAVKGFYWRSIDSSSVKDSLLYAISIGQDLAQSFSTSSDGKYLFFGNQTNTSEGPRAQILKLDVSIPGQNPTVIFDARGQYLAVQANPITQDQLLVNYFFGGDAVNPPQAHIVLLNHTTLSSIDLDVRTYPSTLRFVINENPYWSPDGKHFAFSAGGADGEGGRYPLELWIYENVP